MSNLNEILLTLSESQASIGNELPKMLTESGGGSNPAAVAAFIGTIIASFVSGAVTIIPLLIKYINAKNRKSGHNKCCITGKPLKKKNEEAKR